MEAAVTTFYHFPLIIEDFENYVYLVSSSLNKIKAIILILKVNIKQTCKKEILNFKKRIGIKLELFERYISLKSFPFDYFVKMMAQEA